MQEWKISVYNTSTIKSVSLELTECLEFTPKEKQRLQISEDTLALSVAWHRIRSRPTLKNYLQPISSLVQQELFNEVTASDREYARCIRDYYSKKIMMWKLLGKQLSHFREDLNGYIHGFSGTADEKLLPLIYRLPEFYEYDIKFEGMIAKLNKEKLPIRVNKPETLIKLKPITSFVLNKKIGKSVEYWFADELGYAYSHTVQRNNSLWSLFQLLFDQPTVAFKQMTMGSFSRDDFHYTRIISFEVAEFITADENFRFSG